MKGFVRWRGRHAVIGVPYLWLLVFFLLPFVIVLRISVSEMDAARFNELLTLRDGVLQLTLKLSNYVFLFDDDLYLRTYLASLKYAASNHAAVRHHAGTGRGDGGLMGHGNATVVCATRRKS